jgi:shikimate kinase
MKDYSCLFLVGMPGCGKSTLGRAYSEYSGCVFVDMDEVIIHGEGKTIEAIYEIGGEQLFRELEHQYIQQYFNQGNTVVCTGGGLPTYKNNMDLMNENGITVFMDVSDLGLWSRVKNTNFKGRPIYQNQTIEQVLETIKRKSAERRPVYEKADVKLRSDEISLNMLLSELNKLKS